MTILAFDTSSEFLSVAIATSAGVSGVHERVGHAHADQLIPTIQRLCRDAGTTLDTIEAIGFGAGPGAFTGLRIACGVAQGLAFSIPCPVAPIGAFEAIAAAAAAAFELAARGVTSTAVRSVRVAIDARMGEVYTAKVERSGQHWLIVGDAKVISPDDVPADGDIAAGSGYAAYPALAARAARHAEVLGDIVPDARVMIRLVQHALRCGEAVDAAQAAPVYLRDRVALTIIERRDGVRLRSDTRSAETRSADARPRGDRA